MLIRLIAGALTSEPLGSPGTVSIANDTSSGLRANTAGISFGYDGYYSKYLHGLPIVINQWLTPATGMGDYEIRATLSSGDTPTGTFGAWTSLATTQKWTLQTSVDDDSLAATVLIEIRWTGNNVVQDSATYTISATGPAAGAPGGGGGNNGAWEP